MALRKIKLGSVGPLLDNWSATYGQMPKSKITNVVVPLHRCHQFAIYTLFAVVGGGFLGSGDSSKRVLLLPH